MRRSLLLLALVGCADAESFYVKTVPGTVQCGDSGGIVVSIGTQYRCARVVPMARPDTLPERPR